MRFKGSLKSWNDERGFGFIEPDQGGDEVFVHIKAIVNLQGRPEPNQRLSFEVELGPQGKKRAKNVMPIRVSRPITRRRETPAQWGTATLFAIPAFLVVYGAATVIWRPPGILALLYIGASFVTFIAYALDKAAAKRSARRTPENTLHVLSLIGGWPGALFAQQLLRHKSAKSRFRAVFWLTAVLNVSGFVALCSPFGQQLLQSA